MNNSENKQNICPICGSKTRYNARYENYICRDCVKLSTDIDGKLLEFFNIDMSGGYKANYKLTKEPYNSHICYISKNKCYATEARFGGIVVRLLEDVDDINIYTQLQ